MVPGSALTTLLVDARAVDHPTAGQRGIGRHVIGLLHGLAAIGAPVVALCSNDIERQILHDSVDGVDVDLLSPGAIRSRLEPGTWFLATQLMLHPIPLDPIPSVVTQSGMPVAALMYDVIPYRHPARYLAEPSPSTQARLRASLARTVDVMLANSEFVRQTAAAELDYPIERISTVGLGATSNFQPASVVSHLWPSRKLPADTVRYVVSVTGTDDRKNTDGLLRAWGQLPDRVRSTHRLVVATGHTPAVLRRWQRWSEEFGVADDVVFTGNIDDDEMVALLQHAALAVVPSLEEGFGLPVLEAAACGCPVICSGVSSLPEILNEPRACFDPTDPTSIAGAIVLGLEDESQREVLRAAGERAVQRWTWERAALATIGALESLGPRWPRRLTSPNRRVAFAGAFAGSASPFGADNEAVVEALGRLRTDTEHVVFVDASTSPEPTHANPNRWPVRALGRYVKPWDFDHIVAILGSAPLHLATSELARRVPCHLWIHDDALVGVQYGANLRALSIARSVIVASDDAAERVRRATDRQCPVLVVSGTIDEMASAVADWLDDVDGLDPSTIRHR